MDIWRQCPKGLYLKQRCFECFSFLGQLSHHMYDLLLGNVSVVMHFFILLCEIPLHIFSECPHTLCCFWRKIWVNSFLGELLPNSELCLGRSESGKERRAILRKTWKGLWDWQGDKETTASSLEYVLAPALAISSSNIRVLGWVFICNLHRADCYCVKFQFWWKLERKYGGDQGICGDCLKTFYMPNIPIQACDGGIHILMKKKSPCVPVSC